jgi:hypothetical protein|tara:strand:- start:263 stop:490 length:228 start_codon:yes stop_codon:yes gene_type:complete
MTLSEIINKLEDIEGSLDDAYYSLPEYNANTDSRDYIDSARDELYGLKEDVEKYSREMAEKVEATREMWEEALYS